MKVCSIPENETWEWLTKKHYAHRRPSIVRSFGLFEESLCLGVCTFGIPPNRNLNEIVPGIESLELNRLVVKDGLQKNTLSFFVGNCLRLLEPPKIIISYADETQGHHGYIYQATNWIYTGRSKGDVEFVKDGKSTHRKGFFNANGTSSISTAIELGYDVVRQGDKHRYIFIVAGPRKRRELMKLIPWKQEPYPKGENRRYDNQLEINTQGVLFN